MTTNWAAVFPGQGSQSTGMLADLGDDHAIVRDTFQEASDCLDADLWSLCQHGPVEQLNQTEWTQPVMLAAGVAAWRLLCAQTDARPQALAGHSLGEYSALVAADVLRFPDAVRLVAERARAMQAAVPEGEGAMAAILGLEDEAVQALCRAHAGDQVLEAVNLNAPGQVVIAGNTAAVDRAVGAAKEAGAKRALRLPVSVPSHCALMQPAAEQLQAVLDRTAFSSPTIPVWQNVTAGPVESAADIEANLAAQLYRPVRWVETIRGLRAQGTGVQVECGPGRVLSGLAKRIDRELELFDVADRATLEATIQRLSGNGA
ncbi:ACP S-malonyltransferase [Thioalkalivibrio sp. ALJ16]|uniref:ACP S-malonyltransferase n=1 Tax=Thioalkalivibrio sp. ALJ16 TaxID=1158762 RepID=UPI0009DA2289|nr:ACP S-malonyltransferase [Thioalkalivibrio sp. ALJ16]